MSRPIFMSSKTAAINGMSINSLPFTSHERHPDTQTQQNTFNYFFIVQTRPAHIYKYQNRQHTFSAIAGLSSSTMPFRVIA
jgi:hypothetical protein